MLPWDGRYNFDENKLGLLGFYRQPGRRVDETIT